jgi:hypothetical protein
VRRGYCSIGRARATASRKILHMLKHHYRHTCRACHYNCISSFAQMERIHAFRMRTTGYQGKNQSNVDTQHRTVAMPLQERTMCPRSEQGVEV